jgi:hypothetical protein
MIADTLSEEVLERIIALFKMVKNASQEDAEDHIKHEAANAFTVLLRLLGKYGLTIGDIPALQ